MTNTVLLDAAVILQYQQTFNFQMPNGVAVAAPPSNATCEHDFTAVDVSEGITPNYWWLLVRISSPMHAVGQNQSQCQHDATRIDNGR
ncbi:hypothetical protein MJ579_29215 [Klebsiella pneumoniae]|nr:hypothetical protein MJ579_29215 [Klebsiella pneumoniae]